jgi:hypothetical protein
MALVMLVATGSVDLRFVGTSLGSGVPVLAV